MSTAYQPTHAESISASPDLLPLARKARRLICWILRQTVQCLVVVVLATAGYFVISHFVLQSVRVVGRSMVPTLYDSQHYFLNRWIYRIHPPRRLDIVVLRDPDDDGLSVKRVVATPGESIFLKDGHVYVNGCELNEPYLVSGTRTFTDSNYRSELILCGKDQFFVLGDNRLNSTDSRTYGPVPRGRVLGPLIR
jgi:signal peptidase I